MTHFQFSLANYYAIELLESTQRGDFTSKEIERLESFLLNDAIKYDHPALHQLIQYDFPEKNALLIENDLLFQKAHYILISNIGFKVHVVSSADEAMLSLTERSYEAVFTRPYQKDRVFNIHGSLYFYITPEEKNLTERFSQQGAKAILELPLNIYGLHEALI